MAPRLRKDLAVTRRRVEDEGEEEVVDPGDLEDDSLSEGSILSDDGDGPEGDEAVILSASTADAPDIPLVNGSIAKNGVTKSKITSEQKKPLANGTSDMDIMLDGLSLEDQNKNVPEVQYGDIAADVDVAEPSPAVVKSTAHMDQPQEAPYERRRREHEEYKKRRDEDPAFVPNRGAFFMHDHRHAGPAANGFRPFGRGRGRGRLGMGGPFAPMKYVDVSRVKSSLLMNCSQMPYPSEPTDAPWAHDMHEIISEAPPKPGQPAYAPDHRGPPTAPSSTPPNRSLSTTKHIGNVQARVFFSGMHKPLVFSGIPVKQYTRLPDHRPPLRRDKPVRISLPEFPPRYIYPAAERSFIFIPRAMRPNQQGFGGRGRGRSGLGSISGFSRRTSVFGGSIYGSVYTPSVAMSRRSSLAREINRDSLVSPAGSTMSRPQVPIDTSRPIVKLPPASQPQFQQSDNALQIVSGQAPPLSEEPPRPQTYPLPQKPTFRENRPNPIPMHQPRPQKAVSVADIESPATLSFNPPQQQQQQPFHQQVPLRVNGHYPNEALLHTRHASYPSQASTGTPLSQIPERAIHAQPFQPTPYQQPNFYPPSYSAMQPPPQSYCYPQNYNNQPMPANAGAPPFVPGQQPQPSYIQTPQQPQGQQETTPVSAGGVQNLIAQEANGMVYYYDASQIPAVANFQYQQPQPYPMQQVGGVVGMGGMMTPSPDGFYYPQPPQGVVYYPQ